MRWRLQKLNWPYAVGELFIVVAGVLIALAVDQWNSNRLDRVEEVEIIGHLISDLQADLESILSGQTSLSEKETSLLRIYSILESPDERPKDMAGFLEDVVVAARYGWGQAGARHTTFDELLGSGTLGLIRNSTIRIKIVEYYDADLIRENRIDEREPGYANLSYRLVPRSAEFEAAKDISEAQIERLFDQLFDASFRDYVVAEINFSRFVNDRFMDWRNRCLELIDELEAYRNDLG